MFVFHIILSQKCFLNFIVLVFLLSRKNYFSITPNSIPCFFAFFSVSFNISLSLLSAIFIFEDFVLIAYFPAESYFISALFIFSKMFLINFKPFGFETKYVEIE